MQKNQKALIRHNLIYQRLKQGEVLNIKVLAEEFSVGERTLQKDFNERLNGIYDIESLGEGNYRLRASHRFKGGDDNEESIAISLMKELQHSAMPEMDEYIEAALSTSSNYDDIFVFGIHFEPIGDVETFKMLIQAIKWKVGIEFTYTKVDGSSKKVLADPYRIANFQNYWYLIAYDPAAELLKTYYFKNISDFRMLYENFTGNAEIENELNMLCSTMDSVWWNGEKRSCLLKVTDKAKHYMERNLPNTMELVEKQDAYLIVRISFYNDMELFAFIKSWIPWIQIVDNDELVKKLRMQVEEFLEL
jgi:predicted DNA-binding transcriptional regulator YafY